METRANPYWRDSLLGNSGPWIAIGHQGYPWRSLAAMAYRVVGDTVFMRGDVYNEHYATTGQVATPAVIFPVDVAPEFTAKRVVLAQGAGMLQIDPDGKLYVLTQSRSLHYLHSLNWVVREKGT